MDVMKLILIYRILFNALVAGLTLFTAMPSAAQGLSNDSKVFTEPGLMTSLEASDPNEIARTWAAAFVQIPDGNGGSYTSTIADMQAELATADYRYPTVIYLHGCSGVWSGTRERLRFYADSGYLVIAPASFARLKYPKSCDVATNTGGLYRGTLIMRQKDAGYAIEQASKLPFVDPNRIVLAGLSQGAITTVTFKAQNNRQKTAARIVEGWTCNAGWPEYKGSNAGADEPVLALVAQNDPWFQNEWTRADCGRFLNATNGSISVVYTEGELGNRHELLGFQEPRDRVLGFLQTFLGLPQ